MGTDDLYRLLSEMNGTLGEVRGTVKAMGDALNQHVEMDSKKWEDIYSKVAANKETLDQAKGVKKVIAALAGMAGAVVAIAVERWGRP